MDAATIVAVGCACLFVLCNWGVRYSLEPNCGWVMYLVAVAAVAAFWGFRYVCQALGLAIASGIVDSLLTILTVAVAIVVFRESLEPRQYVGLGLLIIGLYLTR